MEREFLNVSKNRASFSKNCVSFSRNTKIYKNICRKCTSGNSVSMTKIVTIATYPRYRLRLEFCTTCFMKSTHREEQVRYLIDTLIRYGTNDAFEAFKDCLQKDYRWLWEKLEITGMSPASRNDSFEDSLSRGDVPRLPDHYVKRTGVEQNVAASLKQLSRYKFLVLHGMSGSGKTTAVISVLRDNPDLITNDFAGVVFWFNLGNCKTDDDIIAQQNKLYRKASSVCPSNSFMNLSVSMSSIGSNADSVSTSCDWTLEDLKDRLKSLFSNAALKECLLVLDEVNEKKFVEAFDIGCKILITTRDTAVVANLQAKIIEINNYFEESESLELFASCIGVEVSRLPRQARKLHEVCKGSPFNIALIGAELAENKERIIDNPKYWNKYLSNFEKKELFSFFRHSERNDPMKTIEVCINSLKPDIVKLYKVLAILPDNVKITSKVLSRLWQKRITEVEKIMKQLRNKSLIIEFYDQDKKDYIYEIHDLIMEYLRTCSTEEQRSSIHDEFLKSYNCKIEGNSVELLDDGYIAFYIGYHILHSKSMKNLFNALFLDLKFLGEKGRLTGPADVILDLQKYETYIAQDELDKNLLLSIIGYFRTYGTDLYRYPCTDIIQSILQHESKGILYTQASELAQKNCTNNELYFDFLHEQNLDEIQPSTIDVMERITSLCFLGDYVLIGTITGLIKMFHISTNHLKKDITVTKTPVKWVGACPTNPPIVACLAFDGVIEIRYIDDIEQGDFEDIIEEEQEEYNNNHHENVTLSPKLGAFINCRWANNQEILITHTAKRIITYNPDGEMIDKIDITDKDSEILCCVPCNNDKYLIVAVANSSHHVLIIDWSTKERVASFEESDTILDILTVPGSDRIIVLQNKEVKGHEFKPTFSPHQTNRHCKCKTVISSEHVKANLTFKSIAVNKSGTLLFVSTDDSRVICIDLRDNNYAFDLENRRGNVECMAVSEMPYDYLPGPDVLLTGTGSNENSAKVWYLEASYVAHNTQKNGKVRLRTLFDVSFLKTESPLTPSSSTPNSGSQSNANTPKRYGSFGTQKDIEKKYVKKTMSLDRQSLKPLNLKGICNWNEDVIQPLLVVVDDKSNIQVMRGRKIVTEITTKMDEQVTTIKISPCNQYVFYGMTNGNVKKYTLRTKESQVIMDLNSPIQYLNFVNSDLLIAAAENYCLMAYRLTEHSNWMQDMLQSGNNRLGSQEILNDMQGLTKMNGPSDRSSVKSENSVSSKDRQFPNGSNREKLCKRSGLVESFWIDDVGLITVENNATVKLWDKKLKLKSVLYTQSKLKQAEVNINCAKFKKNTLVICDDFNRKFQVFELRREEHPELQMITDYQLNNRIVSCDLTSDSNLLAMGLDSGDVVVWSIPNRRQMRLLKHHKTRVTWCSFSPVPSGLFTSNVQSPPNTPSLTDGIEEQPPLVLVTMATEIVWWNISYMMRQPQKIKWRVSNVVTPQPSPLVSPQAQSRSTSGLATAIENLTLDSPSRFFFGEGLCSAQSYWRNIWKGKTYKRGSKRKDILSCIKLSGMHAKKLCHDDKFSCFVTVDNPGHVHIMSVMKCNDT